MSSRRFWPPDRELTLRSSIPSSARLDTSSRPRSVASDLESP